MSTPFMGEIRLWSLGTYVPQGWALCDGRSMSIASNQALFSLLGNAFGGDGTTNFLLPNLQGRVVVGANSTLPRGAAGGEEAHVLATAEIPNHTHTLSAQAANATFAVPNGGRSLGQAVATGGGAVSNYGAGTASVAFAGDAVGNNAGGQGHENRQPFLGLNYCIALQGSYPPKP